MKNILKIFSSLLLFSFAFTVQAQTVSLDMESGDRNKDAANCWAFGAIGYANKSNYPAVINGTYAGRTNQLTNISTSACWLKSPWFQPVAGNITFKVKLDGNPGTTRGLQVFYIPFNENAKEDDKVRESTPVSIYTFSFPTATTTTLQNISVPVPTALLADPNKYFKIQISFVGTGGTGRAFIDDVVIPGTYFSNPSENCLPKVIITDSDSDGVKDADDAYPNDATKAYNNYLPAKGYSTLMFEDLWPSLGDYDFNDYVVDYKLNRITNAKNKVVEVQAEFISRAAGASRNNSFAFSFDELAPSKILSVKGNSVTSGIFSFNANGTEAKQSSANIVVISEIFKVLVPTGQGVGVNTTLGLPAVNPVTTTVSIAFDTKNTTTELDEVGLEKFNPYLIVNQVRGVEIHLPNKAPSSLVNKSLLKTGEDDYKEGEKCYKSKTNLPWALSVTGTIPYMQEKIDFTKGYLKFYDWAQSGGKLYTDWYLDLPSYRNTKVLY